MLEIVKQSWFFFRVNYAKLLPFLLPIIVVQWLITTWLSVPEQAVAEISDTVSMEDVFTQLVEQLSLAAIVFIVLFSILRTLYFVCVYQQILQYPDSSASSLVSSVLARLVTSSVSFLLFWAGLALFFVALMSLTYSVVPFVVPLVFALFLYVSIRLAFLPAVIVHANRFTPLASAKESFSLTKGKMLQIIGLFLLFFVAVGISGGVLSLLPGSAMLAVIVPALDAIVQIHLLALLNLAIYRLYLRAKE